mmetsp:Transcript_111629/g.360196  ORF Transcript_111629/g.360196 Transcript_111629/m.360196 type:complete len:215 (-) Transcript_111629:286-930(-)
MVRMPWRKACAIAYSAITVLPADVCAQTKTCSERSTRRTARFWKGSSSKGNSNAGFGTSLSKPPTSHSSSNAHCLLTFLLTEGLPAASPAATSTAEASSLAAPPGPSPPAVTAAPPGRQGADAAEGGEGSASLGVEAPEEELDEPPSSSPRPGNLAPSPRRPRPRQAVPSSSDNELSRSAAPPVSMTEGPHQREFGEPYRGPWRQEAVSCKPEF